MPILSTDTLRYTNLVKKELFPESAFCRDSIVANETVAKTYAVGTVLGKVTATGKYKICVQNAADGSQTAAAVVVEDKAVAANTDTKVLVLLRGPAQISKTALVLDASHSTNAHKQAIYDAFEAKFVLVNDAV